MRNYECRHCGKAFKQRQGLRIHQAIHSVERPYKCECCTKAFTQRSALVRHSRTHTAARPYTCRLCPSTFNDYSILRRHMMGIHKLQDAVELRHSVQAACAEARLTQRQTADKSEGLCSTSSAMCTTADSSVNRTTVSTNDDAAVPSATACIDMVTVVPAKPDQPLGTSAGQLLTVLLTSSQGHADTQVSMTDSLPQYFVIDAWPTINSHQHHT